MSARCYNCTERYVGCHATCDLYQMFRRARDTANKRNLRELEADEVYRSFIAGRKKRAKKAIQSY